MHACSRMCACVAEPRNGCTDDVGLARAPGLQAPKSFNVLTDTYGAEYGKRAGGQISIVSSAGTDQLHGDAFEYLRKLSTCEERHAGGGKNRSISPLVWHARHHDTTGWDSRHWIRPAGFTPPA